MSYITAICIVGIITWFIYKLVELFARRKERTMIIEKLGEQIGAEDVRGAFDFPLFPKVKSSSFLTMKTSLLMIGVGIGLIVSFFFQYNYIDMLNYSGENYNLRENVGELKFLFNFAGVTIFGGLGLLIAYFIEAKKNK